MTAKDRLQSLLPTLEAQGVRDVKFCFAPNVFAVPVSKVQECAFDLLDSYLKGRTTDMVKVGDEPLPA